MTNSSPTNESDDIAVRQSCCAMWAKAHTAGTDCEAIRSLVDYNDINDAEPALPQLASADAEIESIHFCPWCGAPKTPSV